MNFLKKLFVRNPEDYLAKGDGLLAAGSFYEARVAYEDGLHNCGSDASRNDLKNTITSRICDANRSLAKLNIEEAQHALNRGAVDKAMEHLELAKTLTDDVVIREKAEQLVAGLAEKPNDQAVLQQHSSCSSCSHISADTSQAVAETDIDLETHEHYELLIHQLPGEMYERYSQLGEDFAYMFIAASQDRHQEALEMLEAWNNGAERDIYYYERGKILHRLGKISESEKCMVESIRENPANPLPHLGLALLLMEEQRLDDAARQIDAMISAEIFTGQALMMRGEVFEMSGDLDAAIKLYGGLLDTPIAKSAAERLHGILMTTGRQVEAAHIFKQYLGKCQH